MSKAGQFQQQFQMVKAMYDEAVKHIPADKGDWQPEGQGRSAKGILEHLAAANMGFAKIIQGESLGSVVDRDQRKDVSIDTDSFEAAVQLFDQSGDQMTAAMGTVSDDQLRNEVQLLRGMRDALVPKLPMSQRAELEERMQAALDAENYELAAILRDELRLM